MNEKINDHQTMFAYLLGSLPEAEAEIIDELSFTDDEFANQLLVAEKDLVDAYVNGELSASNLEKFKTHYLASPVRRERVEFAKTFQTFAEKEFAQTITEEPPKKNVGFFSNIFSIPRLSLQWGFALATLALMLFGGWLFWENTRLRSQISQAQSSREELLKRESELAEREKLLQNEITNQPQPEIENELTQIRQEREKLEQELKKSQEQKRLMEQRETEPQRAQQRKVPNPQLGEKELVKERKKGADGQGIGRGEPPQIATFVLLPSLRSGQLPTLSIPAQTDLVNVQLQLESDDFRTYRIVLQDPTDNQTIWRSRTAAKTKGKNKVLNLQFPAGLLKSNIYSLEVSGVAPDGTAEIISNYSFRAVIK